MRKFTHFALSITIFPFAAPAIAETNPYQFTLTQAASPLSANLSLSAKTSGTLIGDYDPILNPTGTRTKPGFSSPGANENLPVRVGVDPSMQANNIASSATGLFVLNIDPVALTVQMTGLQAECLAGGALTVPVSARITFLEAFRTANPSATYFAVSLDAPLGDANITSLVASQVGSPASGTLTPIGANQYSFTLTPDLVLQAKADLTGTNLDSTSDPTPTTITGQVTLSAGGAVVSASGALNLNQVTASNTPLDPFPFPLPTLLGGTANVIFNLTLTETTTVVSGTQALSGNGVLVQWTGAASPDPAWATAGNWSATAPAGPAAIANFLQSDADAGAVQVPAGQVAGTVRFNNANAYTLQGGSLQLGDAATPGTIEVVAGSHAILTPITVPNALTISGPGALTITRVSGEGLTVSTSVALAPDSPTSAVRGVTLSSGARLDLANNDLVLNFNPGDADPAEDVRLTLLAGYNGGTWTGPGLASSAAAAHPARLTAIGYVPAASILTFDGSGNAAWSGVTVDATSLLLKYTWYGDANLDGTVTADDYFRIDTGFLSPGATGWYSGDFNYDDRIDIDDYFLIDMGYARQGTPLSLAAPAAVPEPAALGLLLSANLLLLRRRPLPASVL